jgi:hypothetical protein
MRQEDLEASARYNRRTLDCYLLPPTALWWRTERYGGDKLPPSSPAIQL